MENYSKYIKLDTRILLNENLNNTDKILYGWIYALTNNNQLHCYATNRYLSKLMNISCREIQKSLKNLKINNIINIEIIDKNKHYIKIVQDSLQTKNNRLITPQYINEFEKFNWLNENF